MVFEFPAKTGAAREVEIDDAVAVDAIEALRRRRSGPDELLAFKDRRGWHRLEPAAVNEFLKDLLAVEVSAKDFRTWHGTVHAAEALAARPATGKTGMRRAVKAAMEEVAGYLGNTATVARQSYVHPKVIDRYRHGETIERAIRRAAEKADADDARAPIERAVRGLLS
jgi:DNA topoisomerase IB